MIRRRDPRRDPRRGARIAAAALGLGLVAGLSACAPSPTTTYTNDAGAEVTVDWRDYPASAWLSAEDVLAGPRTGEVPERLAALLDEVQQALADEYGLGPWTAHGDPADYADWSPMRENEYGGESMLATFNSQTWSAEGEIPFAEWERVVDTVAAVAERHGLTERTLTDDLDPGYERWLRDETLSSGDTEWLMVTVQNAHLDPSGEAVAEAEEQDWLVSGVSLFYGVTTVLDEDRAEFERRAAPFEGLALPKASHPS